MGEDKLVEAIPGREFGASGWYQLWFGRAYRDLWTRPATFPVLDLAAEAGGLAPVRRVGSKQTLGLAMKGNDGRSYTFRSLRKTPERKLPAALRSTWAGKLLHDQESAMHPAAAVILPRLADAAAVANTHPRLVVMPDDPVLGVFREAFGGAVGTFEVYPTPGAGGATFPDPTEILSSGQLWDRWLAGPATRVDSIALLRARILDLFVHNYDRHRGQWRWVQVPGEPLLEPLPEDPDASFLRHDGLIPAAIRAIEPTLEIFKDHYPRRLDGMLTNGSEIDRWLLSDLDREAFRRTAVEVRARLSDAVIEEAAKGMPSEWFAIDGPRLSGALRERRDGLVEYIDRVYLYLARDVDIQATNQDEQVTLEQGSDGSLRVTVAVLDPSGVQAPYFSRRFLPGETREVRVHLRGGRDRTVSEGGRGKIRVRVVGGEGQKTIDDRNGGNVEVWPGAGTMQVVRGPGTREREGVWRNPEPIAEAPWQEPRNFGHWTSVGSKVAWSPDLHVLVGAALTRTAWAFRAYPYASRQTVQGFYSTEEQRGWIGYAGTFYRPGSGLSTQISTRASGIDHLNFYGFGNATQSVPRERRRTQESTFVASPAFRYELSHQAEVTARIEMRYASSPKSAGASILSQRRPYGVGSFGLVGVGAGFEVDTRGRADQHASLSFESSLPAAEEYRVKVCGIRVQGRGAYRPAIWDVKSAYGLADGMVAGYVGSPNVILAGRVGGRQVFGDYPWFDAAVIGGSNDRGFRQLRFAGDRSLYAGGELRWWAVNLARFRMGLFGFGDTGRVWVRGEDSDRWHDSYGGGLLLQPSSTALLLRAQVAHSREETLVYFGSGFSF